MKIEDFRQLNGTEKECYVFRTLGEAHRHARRIEFGVSFLLKALLPLAVKFGVMSASARDEFQKQYEAL